ncbi:MAG: hypothetical protein MR021_06205 [Clostridiales bacterium]|nr:hypothetical protein [Clostridiales bacterium]
MLRIVDPPEIKEETEKLLDAWMEIPEEHSPTFDDYCAAHCSEHMKAYLRECAEVQEQLKPGEYV